MNLQQTIIIVLICVSFFAVSAWMLSGSIHRRLALALFLLSIPAFTYAYAFNLGQARPYYPSIRLDAPDEYQDVRDFKIIKDVGIFFLLDNPNDKNAVPLFIFKPWDANEARRLQNSVNSDDGHGTMKFKPKGGFKGFEMQKQEVIEKEVPIERLMDIEQYVPPDP